MLKHNEPMSSHCSFRTGGPALVFFTPENLDQLTSFLQTNTQPILFLGLGSNLLVRDQGFNGVVIKTNHLNNITDENNTLVVEAGTTLAKLSRTCINKQYYGAEFLSAIPGTLGGALAMNAGAFGSEIWQFVQSVNTVNTSGEIQQRLPEEFDVSYRRVHMHNKDEFFLSAVLKFDHKHPINNIKELLNKRNQSQPIGLASCGSVFKNPKGHFAAKLIEQSHLKGYCIGGACVSDKHANFIINHNNASSYDIERLIQHIQQTVKSTFDITLEPEVKIVGSKA